MTLRDLARRSRRHFWRSHLGLLAGTSVAAAVLVGALVVGDSVRGTLQARVRERLGFGIVSAMDLRDRFVTTNLPARMSSKFPAPGVSSLRTGDILRYDNTPVGELVLPATATRQDGASRANQVRLHGVTPAFILQLSYWLGSNAPAGNNVWLGEPLARQLQASVGDSLVLRIHRPGALSREAVLSPRDDQSVALRVRVDRILTPSEGGNYGLHSGAGSPLNAFVAYDTLATAAGLYGRMNLLLGGPLSRMEEPRAVDHWSHKLSQLTRRDWKGFWNSRLTGLSRPLNPESGNREMTRILEEAWSLEDAEASLRLGTNLSQASGPQFLELTSRRIFIDPPIATAALSASTNPAAPSTPVVTYLVNAISAGNRMVPYSMVTAAGPPYTPADLKDDEILVNTWLAEDLGLHPGDTVQLAYYRADSGSTLVEQTNQFRVRAVVPMEGVHADRSLMPEFPGLAKAESTRDWDAGFDLVHKIRDRDEAYWKQWRGTPKAFINARAGQRIWGNRFGDFTAIRWFLSPGSDPALVQQQITGAIRSHLRPADLGMVWQPVAEMARKGAATGQDFGGLFIGFSFFLIVASLLLTSMLFQFALDLRLQETGILLALGWPPRRVRRVLFREGLGVAAIGTLAGALLGIAYARGILWGLNTLWSQAVAGESLFLDVRVGTVLGGAIGAVLVAATTLWFSLRNRVKQPARLLLSGTEVLDDPGLQGTGALWTRRGAILTGILA
ncbi:MAG: ABC transporter permease, partial [Verrucomicrobiota bacterium]